MRRLALLVEYDGTAYGGSQHQTNAPTVQGALESALSSLTGEQIRVALAGRTDAGVHARGQVAAFLTASRHQTRTFVRALNALLPADISIRGAAEVPLPFDPRRQAKSRWYRYALYLRAQRSPLLRNRVWHIPWPVDLEAMRRATGHLVGRHDFAAFAPPSEARRGTTERVVYRADWRGGRKLAELDIEGNAFLRHMVRRVVAALVDVGRGRRSVEEFRALVEDAVPGTASATAPARGLCLMRVRYESGMFDDETNEDI